MYSFEMYFRFWSVFVVCLNITGTNGSEWVSLHTCLCATRKGILSLLGGRLFP